MASKNTFFSTKTTLNCGGQLLDLRTPRVMGILNVTPDSFFDGGKFQEESSILFQVEKMLKEGATIIDVGAVSSRPSAPDISENEECNRLVPAIKSICQQFPDCLISIDTFRANVARQCLDLGGHMINDIGAGRLDAEMFATIEEFRVPYVMMHMKGLPSTMQQNPEYIDVMEEVQTFFTEQLSKLNIPDVIIDPGFGFGKTVEHNYEMLNRLSEFRIHGKPVLAGVSRKSMIFKPLKINPEKALNATTALHMMALEGGAQILRAHDVKEAMEAIQIQRLYHGKG